MIWVRIYLGHLLHRLGALCFHADCWLNPIGEPSDGPLFPCPFCPPPGGGDL